MSYMVCECRMPTSVHHCIFYSVCTNRCHYSMIYNNVYKHMCCLRVRVGSGHLACLGLPGREFASRQKQIVPNSSPAPLKSNSFTSNVKCYLALLRVIGSILAVQYISEARLHAYHIFTITSEPTTPLMDCLPFQVFVIDARCHRTLDSAGRLYQEKIARKQRSKV